MLLFWRIFRWPLWIKFVLLGGLFEALAHTGKSVSFITVLFVGIIPPPNLFTAALPETSAQFLLQILLPGMVMGFIISIPIYIGLGLKRRYNLNEKLTGFLMGGLLGLLAFLVNFSFGIVLQALPLYIGIPTLMELCNDFVNSYFPFPSSLPMLATIPQPFYVLVWSKSIILAGVTGYILGWLYEKIIRTKVNYSNLS